MNMEFSCQEAVPMIGAYLDGELSPARAALLRPHLLECPACRNAAADGRSLQRWFEPLRESAASGELAVAVPSGFSARVARRAFAGDRGERGQRGDWAERAAPAREEGRILPFVLRLTAVAAAAALLFALGVQLASRPQSTNLAADDRAALPLVQIQSELDRLNGVAPTSAPVAPESAEAGSPRGKKRPQPAR
jgi:anti-sigma factor RsiW